MNKRNFVGNVIYAFISQGIALTASILMSLIIPKVLGIKQYSYWQLFMFYNSYVGFFHFGLNDGVYLRIGGMKYEELDKSLLGTQIKLSVIAQSIIAFMVVVIVSLFTNDSNRVFVWITTGVYLVIYNLACFVGYIFQAVNKTRIFSLSVMIDKIIYIAFIFILMLAKVKNFEQFIIYYIIAKTISLIYIVYVGRELFFSKLCDLKTAVREIGINISVGIKLMIASIASSLVIGIGRQIIDMRWGIEAFGKFSFALSMSNFFLLFIMQVSMVLFPALRQSKDEQIKSFYHNARAGISTILPIVYLGYPVISILLNWWLPNYSESIKYLALILPLCTFDGKMSMICSTYMKVLRKEKILLFINLGSMLLSLCLASLGAWILNSMIFITVSMVISIAARSIVSEIYISKLMGGNIAKNLITEITISAIFMIVSWFLNNILSFAVMCASYAIFLVINRESVKITFGNIKAMTVKKQ